MGGDVDEEISDLKIEGGIVPRTYDRRTFLTHSAATVGGVAMAGTVVDSILADVAGASTVGVGSGSPVRGGTLTVGLSSDTTSPSTFSGQTGKLDSNGFCIANAIFDTIFLVNAAANGVLPNLGLSAAPSNNYQTWTIQLRQGVQFHDGSNFTAQSVVDNYTAAKNNATVGTAIAPLLADVQVGGNSHEVVYHVKLPWVTFPYYLAEQQIAYMAGPAMFANGYSGAPIGTGPFRAASLGSSSNWIIGNQSTWVANSNYWRNDANGKNLPYLGKLIFKVLVDPATRLSALRSGSIGMGIFTDGQSIKSIEGGISVGGKKVAFIDDRNSIRQPSMNCLIVNVQGKTEFTATAGGVNPSTLKWQNGYIAPMTDLRIRQAFAHSLNTASYLKTVDSNIGAVSNGIFRTSSAYYKNPNYPAYNATTAKALVALYKKDNKTWNGKIALNYVSGSKTATTAFSFIAGALKPAGITVVPNPMTQSTLINNCITKTYDVATWSQFGGIFPDLNYVWWDKGNLANFAGLADDTVQNAMQNALGATTVSAQIGYWQTVNSEFAAQLPYIWLDETVSCWAASAKVSNWNNAHASGSASGAVNATTACFNPSGGSIRWDEIWA